MKKNLLLSFCISALTITSINAQTWTPAGTWVNSSIECLKSFNGKLFVGGNFTGVGTNTWNCNFNAQWDGSTLTPYYDANLGGLDFNCFEIHNSTLYVGGAFNIGSFGPKEVAVWDGTSWDDPTGAYQLNSNVYAMASFGGKLYMGGYFTTYNSVNYNHVASNSGSGYSTVGSGFDATVMALAVYNGALYAGGGFTNSGTTAVNHIAKWNGTSWQQVGTGVNGTVSGMAVMGTDLYVIGSFTLAGSTTVKDIAKWNGTIWSDVGGGLSGGFNGIRAVISYNNYLYVGGDFTTAGSISAKNVAAWNGSSWFALGNGITNSVNALEIYNNALYAGPFSFANDTNYVWKFSSLAGVNETTAEKGFTVNASYNSYSNAIQLNIESEMYSKFSFMLYDMLGKNVANADVVTGANAINIGFTPNGIYNCEVSSEKGKSTTKVFVLKQ
ncbi:MAG: T9SS type A sorting domain-containing protein [Bacteroidetes bacterium]|nr:T9SS type A sorting domain-containing protein [Bacteroidota bacterium]